MQKELLKDTVFRSKVKEFYTTHKGVLIDIILFGSSVRGKEYPGDIDLLLLFKDKKGIELGYQLRKLLKEYNVEVIAKDYQDLFQAGFIVAESVLSEGYSLINRQFLASGLGYDNFILFRYELNGLGKSERMRFYYSLHGRQKQDGILKDLHAIKFSDTILLCPVGNAEKMKEYLSSWKIKYLDFPILVPRRISNIMK